MVSTNRCANCASCGEKTYPNSIRWCTEHPSSCGRSGSFLAESLGVTLNLSHSIPVVKKRAWYIQKLTSCPVAQTVFYFCQQHSERVWQSRENKLCISSIGERRVCLQNGRRTRKTNHKDSKGHGYVLFFRTTEFMENCFVSDLILLGFF